MEADNVDCKCIEEKMETNYGLSVHARRKDLKRDE